MRSRKVPPGAGGPAFPLWCLHQTPRQRVPYLRGLFAKLEYENVGNSAFEFLPDATKLRGLHVHGHSIGQFGKPLAKEKKLGLIHIHLIPPSRKSRESPGFPSDSILLLGWGMGHPPSSESHTGTNNDGWATQPECQKQIVIGPNYVSLQQVDVRRPGATFLAKVMTEHPIY
jgi:hypothetical protein